MSAENGHRRERSQHTCLPRAVNDAKRLIKTEPDSDSVQYLADLYLEIPEVKMSLTWDEIKGETRLRDVITSEIEDILFNLEKLNKREISPTAFQFAYDQVDGLMVDLKALNAAFRKKIVDGGLLNDPSFKEDSKEILSWQINVYNRLDKIKPAKMQAIPEQRLNLNQNESLLSDTLYNLERTLQQHNDDRDTHLNLNKPHFKGGSRDCYLKFEKYRKDFKIIYKKY